MEGPMPPLPVLRGRIGRARDGCLREPMERRDHRGFPALVAIRDRGGQRVGLQLLAERRHLPHLVERNGGGAETTLTHGRYELVLDQPRQCLAQWAHAQPVLLLERVQATWLT